MRTIHTMSRGELLRLASYEGQIEVHEGSAWITLENEGEDRVLERGQGRYFSGRNLVLEAVADTTFELKGRPRCA